MIQTHPRRAGICALLLLALCAGTAPAEEASPDTEPAFFAGNEELRGYLLEAVENHPLLKAHYEDWLAAMERIPQAGALEDTEFTYTQFLRSSESYFMVALMQKFPWFGTRRVRKEKAMADAEYWLAHLHEQRNAVFREVKSAYFKYANLGDRLAIMGGQISLMKESAEIAASRYASGWSPQNEVLRTEIELARMNDMLRELEQMEPVRRAALNAALGRPQDGALPFPASTAFPDEPPAADTLGPILLASNPSLRMFDHTVEAEEKEVELARRMGRPDITVGIDYLRNRDERPEPNNPYAPGKLQTYRMLGGIAGGAEMLDAAAALDIYDTFLYEDPRRDPQDEISVSIGVNLPIWRKRIKAGVLEKQHMVAATQRHKQDELRKMESMAREARFMWDDATRRMALYADELLVKEDVALEGLRAGYAAGDEEITLMTLLESMRNLMQFQLEFLDALHDKHQAATDLEYLLGAPWSSTEIAAEATPVPTAH
ncbi:MAG: TolC family protein [Candidatus Hydrogenedentes bacterium]|nr:TolC family protein [Candidatus Hydrogenedentota bacterium]